MKQRELLDTANFIGENWEGPSDELKKELCRKVVRSIHFLDGETMTRLVESNASISKNMKTALDEREIDSGIYLWENGCCAFPGIRRYRGTEKKGRPTETGAQALLLDDNTFPKQIWAHLILDREVKIERKSGWTLAHILDHKTYNKDRVRSYFPLSDQLIKNKNSLSGLFTSASNTVFVPSVFAGLTDENEYLRDLLVFLSTQLYGKEVSLFPHGLKYQYQNKDESFVATTYDEVRRDMKVVQFNQARFTKFLDYRSKQYRDLGIRI